jgi:hypothetical protein
LLSASAVLGADEEEEEELLPWLGVIALLSLIAYIPSFLERERDREK